MGALQGSFHGRWKGGTYVNDAGYLRISAGPLRGEYVHIIVAEAKIGRPIDPLVEEVHHVDENKLNCAPDNLEVKPLELHRAFLNGQPWIRKKRRARRQAGRQAGNNC
jgi:hypothetical protein